MNKPVIYVVGVFSAVVAALILYVFAADVFRIAEETIAAGSLASAGILSVACAVCTLW